MMKEAGRMLAKLFHPGSCSATEDLRRAVELHGYSARAMRHQADKQHQRNSDIQTTVAAALKILADQPMVDAQYEADRRKAD